MEVGMRNHIFSLQTSKTVKDFWFQGTKQCFLSIQWEMWVSSFPQYQALSNWPEMTPQTRDRSAQSLTCDFQTSCSSCKIILPCSLVPKYLEKENDQEGQSLCHLKFWETGMINIRIWKPLKGSSFIHWHRWSDLLEAKATVILDDLLGYLSFP